MARGYRQNPIVVSKFESEARLPEKSTENKVSG
jgi:hypothetical protein